MNSSKRSSCSTSYRNYYVSPYERLLRRNRSWRSKKFEEERELQKLCEEGELTPFEQPQNYVYFFIHGQMDIQLLDDLIDQAKLLNHFSMDTEDDPLLHRPATLQVEFIRHNLPSIVIIIEVQYLPPSSSPLFKKIQHLCGIIFTSNNHIYSWGPPLKELKKFYSFNLFNTNINIKGHDIQEKFSTGQLCSLQSAIEFEFKQYLDKTATLAEWACGVDLSLGTYIPEHVTGPERTYRIQEEKKYRSILTQYAINDVFAVTKLIHKTNLSTLLTPPATIEEEGIYDEELNDKLLNDTQDEPSIELQPLQEELIVHVQDELTKLNQDDIFYDEYLNVKEDIEQGRKMSITDETKISNNNIEIYEDISEDERDEFYYNESRKVHVINEPMEVQLHYDSYDQPLPDIMKVHLHNKSTALISNNEYDNQSLPEIMKVHLQHKPNHLYKQQHYHERTLNNKMKVHVQDEPHQVRNLNYLDSNSTTINLTPKQIQNQKTNLRHRANRYRYEVIRRVYPLFRTTQCKMILKSMNIFYVNVNVVRHILFIGLKNQEVVNEVEQLLHERMFTEQHFNRLYGK